MHNLRKERTMFDILAKSFKVATRSDGTWSAPDHWVDHDHRTRAQKERDSQDQRRWLRQTGIM
ncbi:hypothetical protein [Gymnodinialimonas ceratoperidinii]|uniref:Uncharacterized protein n=1 Tax=Gymnodinialimonas ceratoperidinii TaxID=2856823 RepID=A0A8F6TYP5_9RHOB|nr:hypothetical protein [Gymnodinialimonas ceratoperidinii]QXT40156.1 hypothetical protein KYE46_02555 [Gymnodinialimonas ceratoperidinii]